MPRVADYLDSIPRLIAYNKNIQHLLLATETCIELEEIAGIWKTYNTYLAKKMLNQARNKR